MLYLVPHQAPVRTQVRTGHQCHEARLSPEGRRIPWDVVSVKLLELPGRGVSVRSAPTLPAALGTPGPPTLLGFWPQGHPVL